LAEPMLAAPVTGTGAGDHSGRLGRLPH
jgi:hypothetical protein